MPAAPPTPAPAPVPAAAESIRIDIVGTSDLHGWAEPHHALLPDGRELSSGGLRNFAGYLDILRQRLPGGVVLVDTGDTYQGTILSNLFEGLSLVPVLNYLDYDAIGIGNHEFDYGPVGPRGAAARPGDDPLGALKAISTVTEFAMLGRNVYVGGSNERPKGMSPTGLLIVERRGIKVGIVGLATPDTVNVTTPVNVAGLRFGDMVSEAKAAAEELLAKGADVLVGVFHEGNDCGDLSDPTDLSSCNVQGGLIPILQALPSGLFDAVIGGHSHGRVGHFINGMPVIQSGAQGYAFGIVELSIDPVTKRSIRDRTNIRANIPVCEQVIAQTGDCNVRSFKPGMWLAPASFEGKPVVPSKLVDEMIAPFARKVAELQAQPLGVELQEALVRQYRSESPLGNALAEVLLAATGADVALLNSGGLRADLKPGALTYGALYEVLPFDNNVATLELTGDELIEMFETLLSSNHGVPQIAGLKLTTVHCQGESYIVDARDSKGWKIGPTKLYSVAMSDFLALGGDGLSKFLGSIPAARKDLGLSRDLNLRDEIAEQIRKGAQNGLPLPGIDGRMTLLSCPNPAKAFPVSGRH